MLSLETEIELVKKLVKLTSICEYSKNEDDFIVNIIPSKKVEITIIDDFVIENISYIKIIFDNDNDIDELIVNIKSGKYHKKGEIVGYEHLDDCDINKTNVKLKSNNKINKLIINQTICTENTYSYYGNQDGFWESTIDITYNPTKYKNIKFSGSLNISTDYVCDHIYDNDKQYDLLMSTR